MNRRRFVWLPLMPAVLLTGGLFGGGLWIAFADSVRGNGLENYFNLIAGVEFRYSLLNTFWVASVSTLISAMLGFLAAIALRQLAQGNRTMYTLIQVPVAVPHLAMAVLVLDLLGQSGLLARVGHAMGLVDAPAAFPELLQDRFSIGVIVTYILKETPFITVVALSMLRRNVADLELAAATLGASPWQRFRYVTLPLVSPSLISASLMVFAYLFGSFEVPFLLGRAYPPMLGVLVQWHYLSPELGDRPAALAAGILMSLLSAVFVFAYLRLSVRLVGERSTMF